LDDGAGKVSTNTATGFGVNDELTFDLGVVDQGLFDGLIVNTFLDSVNRNHFGTDLRNVFNLGLGDIFGFLLGNEFTVVLIGDIGDVFVLFLNGVVVSVSFLDWDVFDSLDGNLFVIASFEGNIFKVATSLVGFSHDRCLVCLDVLDRDGNLLVVSDFDGDGLVFDSFNRDLLVFDSALDHSLNTTLGISTSLDLGIASLGLGIASLNKTILAILRRAGENLSGVNSGISNTARDLAGISKTTRDLSGISNTARDLAGGEVVRGSQNTATRNLAGKKGLLRRKSGSFRTSNDDVTVISSAEFLFRSSSACW
jgi:hypothetical protein